MIAWPLQPSGSMPPKRVIHKLLKGNTSTSQMCDQLAASVDSVIFFTLLAMNVVQWHAGLANHASTIVESVQQWSFDVSLGWWLRPSRTKGEPRITSSWEGTPFWLAPHASWPWASAPSSYGPPLRAHRSQLRMPLARRHRIRDALRGSLDGRKPIWVFWPGLWPNSSGESCSTFGTAQLASYRPNLDPEAKSLA